MTDLKEVTKTYIDKYYDDPLLWIEKVLRVHLWSKQKEIVESVFNNRRTTVRAAYSVGKTFVAACTALAFIFLRPPAKIITTAPCFDDKTEILTKFGWKLFKDLNAGDKVAQYDVDNKVTFVDVEDFVSYFYEGDMIGYKNQLCDFLVTPEHRCVLIDKDGNLKIKQAKDIYGSTAEGNYFPRYFEIQDIQPTDLSLDMMEFLGFWFAEGYVQYDPPKRRYRITIAQKTNTEYLEDLFTRIGYSYHKYLRNDESGVYNYEVYKKEIAEFFVQFKAKANEKRLPEFILNTDTNSAKAFLKGFLKGDGTIDKNNSIKFYTSSKQLADDLQLLCLKIGWIANIAEQKKQVNRYSQRPLYRVSVWQKRGKRVDVRREHWYKEHYSGQVYCVKVPSGIVVVRRNGKIICSGNSWYQVRFLLWSEIAHLFKTKLQPLDFPGEVFQTMLRIAEHWFAVGISPKEDINFQGFHQKNVLVILDEAPGVREEIAEGADSLLASGNAHMLKIGNPTKSSGHFYDDFRDASINTFRISAFDSPNFTGEDVPDNVRAQLVNEEWVNARKTRWGEDSPLYVSRVLANFPIDADERQLISLALCEDAVNRDIEPTGEKEMGLDVARFGDDLTCYVIRQGKVISKLLFDSKRDTMEVAGRAKRIYEDEDISRIKADVIGIGSGVVDRLTEQRIKIIGINSAENAIESDRYFNKRTEMWFNAMEWLKTGKIPDDDLLIRDLTAVRFEYTSKGQYKLELKDHTKKRLGYSPDRGDAFVLAIHHEVEKIHEAKAESVSYSADDLMEKMGIR